MALLPPFNLSPGSSDSFPLPPASAFQSTSSGQPQSPEQLMIETDAPLMPAGGPRCAHLNDIACRALQALRVPQNSLAANMPVRTEMACAMPHNAPSLLSLGATHAGLFLAQPGIL